MQTQLNPQKNPRRRKRTRRIKIFPILLGILAIVAIFTGFRLHAKNQNRLWDPVSRSEIQSALEENESLSPNVQTVIDSAVSLVGKVHYFWGGKSESVGWDDRWGTLTEVTSEGSSTTGTQRPFGLDCSGFVTWCFLQTGYTWDEAVELVGNGTYNQWALSREISWEELRPGDFAFQHEPNDPEGNHIGICIGFDASGEPLFAHCAAGENNVVVTHADNVFHYARRPNVFCES